MLECYAPYLFGVCVCVCGEGGRVRSVDVCRYTCVCVRMCVFKIQRSESERRIESQFKIQNKI